MSSSVTALQTWSLLFLWISFFFFFLWKTGNKDKSFKTFCMNIKALLVNFWLHYTCSGKHISPYFHAILILHYKLNWGQLVCCVQTETKVRVHFLSSVYVGNFLYNVLRLWSAVILFYFILFCLFCLLSVQQSYKLQIELTESVRHYMSVSFWNQLAYEFQICVDGCEIWKNVFYQILSVSGTCKYL